MTSAGGMPIPEADFQPIIMSVRLPVVLSWTRFFPLFVKVCRGGASMMITTSSQLLRRYGAICYLVIISLYALSAFPLALEFVDSSLRNILMSLLETFPPLMRYMNSWYLLSVAFSMYNLLGHLNRSSPVQRKPMVSHLENPLFELIFFFRKMKGSSSNSIWFHSSWYPSL